MRFRSVDSSANVGAVGFLCSTSDYALWWLTKLIEVESFDASRRVAAGALVGPLLDDGPSVVLLFDASFDRYRGSTKFTFRLGGGFPGGTVGHVLWVNLQWGCEFAV